MIIIIGKERIEWRGKHKLVPWNECYKTTRLYSKSDHQSMIHFNFKKIEIKSNPRRWMKNECWIEMNNK